jgi:uncharacterized protein
MMRVVVDANMLVSAVLSPHGAPAQILTAWRAHQFDLVISAAILAEIGRVFSLPENRQAPSLAGEAIADLSREPGASRHPDPRHTHPNGDHRRSS